MESLDQATREISALLADHLAIGSHSFRESPPRYRYFQYRNGALHCWTVQPDYTDECPDCGGGGLILDPEDFSVDPVIDCPRCEGHGIDRKRGWYYSFTYRPIGPGSRSNRATTWRLYEEGMVRHRKRKDAKARALKLHRKEVSS